MPVAAFGYLAIPANRGAPFHDAFGALGIARLVGWLGLAYAITKLNLLDIPLPHVAIRRGVPSAVALALLFIVAQIAQNFFAAEYGLLLGSIVAGYFLFAATPIQRAIERAGRPRGDVAPAQNVVANEDAFRRALRVALRDKVLTREEEIDLHHLAAQLGIPAGRAHELLVAVERETRAH